MELYFGGAYNGKLRYVKNDLDIKDEDIYYCKNGEIDFSKKVISGIHLFIYNNVIEDIDSLNFFENNLDKLRDKILICDDLSSGIVPLKKEERRWREDTGKVLQFLSNNSSKVVRVFCGLPQVIKYE